MPNEPLIVQQEEIRLQYLGIMEEIKKRITAIDQLLNGVLPPQHMIVTSEYCYLQLRMICELIVMACALAHGETRNRAGRKLGGAWNARLISNLLEDLHPEFYPVPTKQILDAQGVPIAWKRVKGGYLTLPQLRSLYDECGKNLHIGTVDRYLAGHRSIVNLDKIKEWRSLIVTLLNHYEIQIEDLRYLVVVLMHSNEDGRPHVNVFSLKDEV